jgi:hypothetical protein
MREPRRARMQVDSFARPHTRRVHETRRGRNAPDSQQCLKALAVIRGRPFPSAPTSTAPATEP